MKYKSCKPEVIRERIIRIKSELRQLRVELRLAEAEQKDRDALQQAPEGKGRE